MGWAVWLDSPIRSLIQWKQHPPLHFISFQVLRRPSQAQAKKLPKPDNQSLLMELTTASARPLTPPIPSAISTKFNTTPPPLHAVPIFSRALSVCPKPVITAATCSLPSDTSTSETKIDQFLELKKRAADLSPVLKGTSLFLVGMKSSIKTNLGKLLADGLRYYYFDSDSLVEEAAGGESAVKSFREADEEGFLASETEVLKQLSSMGRLVVCAGDGAVQSSTNLALLRHGISLWIDVPLQIVASEMTEDQTQLTLPDNESDSHSEALTQLVALYEELRGGYATADATVSLQNVASKLGYEEMDLITTEDMVLEALREIEKLTRVKKMMEAAARPF